MLGQFRVQQRLSQAMKRGTDKLGLRMTPACNQMMEQLILKGVQRMQSQKALERETQVRLAEDNLRRCLDRFGKLASENKTFPMVNENIFDQTVRELCPLWPFC